MAAAALAASAAKKAGSANPVVQKVPTAEQVMMATPPNGVPMPKLLPKVEARPAAHRSSAWGSEIDTGFKLIGTKKINGKGDSANDASGQPDGAAASGGAPGEPMQSSGRGESGAAVQQSDQKSGFFSKMFGAKKKLKQVPPTAPAPPVKKAATAPPLNSKKGAKSRVAV